MLRTKLKVKDEDTSNFLLFQLDNVQQSYHFWLGRNSATIFPRIRAKKKKHSHNNKDKAQKIKSQFRKMAAETLDTFVKTL